MGAFPKIEPAGWNGPLSLGPWMQVFAARQSIETQSAFDQTIAKLHIGIDGELKGVSRAPIILGLFAGLGGIDQDFEGSASETETDARLAGAYAAYNNGETYGQALVKYEHQQSTLRSAATDDDGAPYEVDVLGLSLEAGRHLAASDTLSFTPHARLTYAHAWAGSFEDASDITIDLSDSDSLRGELALRLDSLLWQQGTASLDAGVRREFLGEQQAVVSDQTFTHDLPGTSGFIAAHLDLDLIEDSLALGLHGEYAKGSDGEDFNGALSLKLKL